jgi:hypothetical protein
MRYPSNFTHVLHVQHIVTAAYLNKRISCRILVTYVYFTQYSEVFGWFTGYLATLHQTNRLLTSNDYE